MRDDGQPKARNDAEDISGLSTNPTLWSFGVAVELFPVLKDKMTLLAYVCLFPVLTNLAHSQIKRGTIVAFQFVNNKFVIAADSRSIWLHSNPDDTYCKLAAFRRQLIFAVAGGTSNIPSNLFTDRARSWDAVEEAHAALLLTPLTSVTNSAAQITAVADNWAALVKGDWDNLYSFHPDVVRRFAEDGNGKLTEGIFALAVNGTNRTYSPRHSIR